MRFQFRAEFFNALNNVNLGTPNRFVNTPQFCNHHRSYHSRPADSVQRTSFVLESRPFAMSRSIIGELWLY